MKVFFRGSAEAVASESPVRGDLRDLRISQGQYHLRFAASTADFEAAFRLRFEVFNLELNEGLEAAHLSGCDTDRFDPVCDHLIVEQQGSVVGTYRLQTGGMAREHLGYYSEREFDFAPYGAVRGQVIELGRACIHRDHRSTEVLDLLWRGIARYALAHGGRFLIGCSSLTSQDSEHGSAVYAGLQQYLAESRFCTHPQPGFAMPLVGVEKSERPPKLLRTYLAIGAKICGPPALDREFKTIDFLTLLDLQALHPRIAARFLGW